MLLYMAHDVCVPASQLRRWGGYRVRNLRGFRPFRYQTEKPYHRLRQAVTEEGISRLQILYTTPLHTFPMLRIRLEHT